ncbi:hypothetical protein [Nitrosopumilus sp.]|uniref:hypothetical protein n=1 Tax=Nitrosopumilus sp. TaxID=2024843 RepID=UPI003D0CD540
MSLQLIDQNLHFESDELDKQIGTLLFAVTVSLFGIVFVTLAHKNLNKFAIGVLTTFFSAILPVLAFLPILLNHPPNLAWFIVVYLIVMLGWFFLVYTFLIGKNNSNKPIEILEKNYARSISKLMLKYILLIFFQILGYYVFVMYFHTKEFIT